MGKEHGTLHECIFAGVRFKLFVSYHPAAALYGAEAKQRLQVDFKKLGQILRECKKRK
jgi:uracil-DNA glycosylase